MVGPHQDNGVPWSPTSPPVATTPVNQVSPGHPSGGYNPNQNQPVVTTPPVQSNVGLGASVHGDQSYVPPPVVPEVTDLRVMETVAGIQGLNPKYEKSWDFNPDNPNNLLHMVDYYGAPTHTLGSLIAVDSSGNPILDSSGNPVYTTFGKYKIDQYRDDPEGFLSGLSDIGWEDIAAEESDFWRNYTAPGGEGGYENRRNSNILDERRAEQMKLFYGPRQSKINEMRQQGFFDTMENPYAADIAETLQKGLYSKTVLHPGQGVLPWGMEKVYATGRARGGIISLLGE